jgi:nucleoside-diphosphate-sugar epimerase
MQILVTGAAGYIGSVLCHRLLRAGHSVTAVDNFMYDNQYSLLPLIGKNFKPIYLDVRDTINLRQYIYKADIIIPLAGLVGAPICERNPYMADEVNYVAIKNMIPEMSSSQKIIFPNTNSGYGLSSEKYCTEESPLEPVSTYGTTKCEAEKVILDHHNSVSLRLATVCGASPRMRFDLLVNEFTARIWWGEHIQIYEGHFRRNFVHIKDVIEAFKLMIDKPNLRGVYNCGDPESNFTKLGLLKRIGLILGIWPDYSGKEEEDPDQRDYFVSVDKLRNTGFVFHHSLDSAVHEIVDILHIYHKDDIVRMGNFDY